MEICIELIDGKGHLEDRGSNLDNLSCFLFFQLNISTSLFFLNKIFKFSILKII